MLWSLALHDADASDEQFLQGLALVEREAGDDRNFVKKAVSMALRAVGTRNRVLRDAAVNVARRLTSAPDPTMNWIGKDALKVLAAGDVKTRVARKQRKKTPLRDS